MNFVSMILNNWLWFTYFANGESLLISGVIKSMINWLILIYSSVIAGIDKLTELADTLNGDSDTAKQLTKYADEYTYTATNKDANYTTKFVYIVQE